MLVAALLIAVGFSAYRKFHPHKVRVLHFDPYTRGHPIQEVSRSKININTASREEMSLLKGIGPVLASRIVEYRTDHGYFLSIEDIKKVKGVGGALFGKIKDDIAVQ